MLAQAKPGKDPVDRGHGPAPLVPVRGDDQNVVHGAGGEHGLAFQLGIQCTEIEGAEQRTERAAPGDPPVAILKRAAELDAAPQEAADR